MRTFMYALVVSCLLAGQAFSLANASRPQLVVFISIDQMRSEYFDRYQHNYTGGFKRFSQEGLYYSNAGLNYASSETGPGHATLVTGTYPAKSGIFENNWTDRVTRKRVYCVQDSLARPVEGQGGGYSSSLLQVSALGDWLKAASPSSKVVSTSSKNRAAVLMGGKRPDFAFWYDKSTGHMVTSSYYGRTMPVWATTFNNDDWIRRNLPPVWSKLLPDSAYAMNGPDDSPGEMLWGGNSSFPHAFRLDKRKEQVLDSPFQDLMLLDFARTAVRGERLGQRDVPDLLCISLSATDYVGHNFGPDSHEQHDNLARLDIAIGTFVADMESIVGRGNLLVVLSADHGCISLPEYATNVAHTFGRRIMVQSEIEPKIIELNGRLQAELRSQKPVIEPDGFINYKAGSAAGMSTKSLEKKIRQGLLQIGGIVDVYFRSELLDKKTPDRPYLTQYRNSYSPARGEDFKLRYAENTLVTHDSTGSEHGSPYHYDTHVPIVFWGPKFRANRISTPVHTVDIAPTVARYLSVPAPKGVDGTILRDVAN